MYWLISSLHTSQKTLKRAAWHYIITTQPGQLCNLDPLFDPLSVLFKM
jgi:hypothetical protein